MLPLELGEVIDPFERKSDAGVGAGRQDAHRNEDLGAVGDRRAAALVVFPELALPFLDVDEDVSKLRDSLPTLGCGAITPHSEAHSAIQFGAVHQIQCLVDIVEGHFLLPVQTKVEVSPEFE